MTVIEKIAILVVAGIILVYLISAVYTHSRDGDICELYRYRPVLETPVSCLSKLVK